MRLKRFIPRSLYGRFVLIIVAPILIIQLVSIYVFYYTHLDVISKHMARNIVEEIAFVSKSAHKPKYQSLINDFVSNVGIRFYFEKSVKLKKEKIADSSWHKSAISEYISPLTDPYNRFKSELENHKLTPYQLFRSPDNDLIIIKIQAKNGLMSFEVPTKKIASSSAYVFTFWMILTALITAFISIIFLKNQIRSIRNLSEVAEKFGRGQMPEIRPSGSREIRSLAIAFIKMKERVIRQISQRTDMLSAVSHDLRTPLTRMRLQLEMMPKSDEITDLKSDIADMEKLIDEYLNFARRDDKEKNNSVKIKNFLEKNIISYYKKMDRTIGNHIDINGNAKVSIKKLSLKRALMNLIDNAFNYGTQVDLLATLSHKNLIITINDNGPGIPQEERDNVFKPFYRIDNSRNLDKKSTSGGSGLGLAIAMDAVTSHGGRIKLADSPLGGLRVIIFIPI